MTLQWKILYKWKNNFLIFHESASHKESSLEKTTGRILLKSFLYEAYSPPFYRKIVFTL